MQFETIALLGCSCVILWEWDSTNNVTLRKTQEYDAYFLRINAVLTLRETN